MPHLVLTLIGPDRPGLVESVAQPVAAHGGNWLESRMARLAGQFAGILLVEVPPDRVASLTAALRGLETHGLRLQVEASAGPADAPTAPPLELDLVGLDRPGIVREISHVLAAHGANIEELTTDRSAAAMSGELLFRARARVQLPRGGDAAKLRVELERIAGDLMVQLKVVEPEPGR